MRLIAASILVVPSLALAQAPEGPPPPPPTPAPTIAPAMMPAPPPMVADTSGPADGWQFQARMPTGLGLDSIISPGISVGHRADGMTIGVQLGLTGGKFTTDNGAGSTNSTSLMLLTVMPMLYYDLWKSPDNRARFNLVVGAGYGRGSEATDSNDGMGGTSHSEATVSFLPLLAGVGGDYFFSPNFGLGVEVSGEVPVLLSIQNNGVDQHVSGNLESIHGLLRATFIVGP